MEDRTASIVNGEVYSLLLQARGWAAMAAEDKREGFITELDRSLLRGYIARLDAVLDGTAEESTPSTHR
ncbi:MAG: hypothetical protein ACREXR_00625 [Gammaproteobacteria bacterium]